MKRLWVILFVIPLFAQEVEKSLTLKKGESRLEIKPGDRVYVRYYKNLKDYKNSYGSIDVKQNEDKSLNQWIRRNKIRMQDGKLNDYQIELLRLIGIIQK